jgi:hypothetical protein
MRLLREPALLLTLLATVVRVVTASWLDVSPTTQTLVNAAVTAVAGAVVAVWVKHEGQVPLILGALQSVLALGVGTLGWSASREALIMSLAGAVAAFWVRTQVVAAVPAPVAVGGAVR